MPSANQKLARNLVHALCLNINLWILFIYLFTQICDMNHNSWEEVQENSGDEDANKRMIIRRSI